MRWPARPARTSCSTRTIRWTGSRGATEALARARAEDKPILLSIGYAACHWCHVMEHESFEDPDTAALMNERFVNIKVDREERPDLDGIYMQAVQAMTGHGGWPMTVFLTPEGVPFYGGTYFPPDGPPRDAVVRTRAPLGGGRVPHQAAAMSMTRRSACARCTRLRSRRRGAPGRSTPALLERCGTRDRCALRRRARRLRGRAEVSADDVARLSAALLGAQRR